ncbi:decarboxylating 6-phosphogluconate dehydrogenase [Fodinisporobacter ferrooxydans]|uniref:Decarboxylating 6-phosphogluconate dehydrogenase n=1 Tax=Fodinisporobacter ferrooxydans TaxID=2901836 RepID=A0ABY4CHC4_9BACL|nr:decarboxylating 6-phosphogluconate dehydrogenase [Alicyclobacillaceae bacterium MYW30-H2]
MKVGLLGLGKMGLQLARNMIDKGHQVEAFDVNEAAVASLQEAGGSGHSTAIAVIEALEKPRIIWLMVPAGTLIDRIVSEIEPYLSEGDIVIDGGNSHYKDSVRRYEHLARKGVHFLDIGTSGGTEGARHGACLMIGGDKQAFTFVEPVIRDIAIADGYMYTGLAGSGHFLKMVHNGIEYGMMQAIAEGFEILEKSQYTYEYEKVAKVWNHGSVIRSWLMELMENAFQEDPKLDSIKGVMHSSGEGKWTIETALDLQVPAPVIAMSLLMRYRSLEEDTFHGKVVAALRNQFGGHAVEKA